MTTTRKADEKPDEQPQAKSEKSAPKERSAERGWVEHGNPSDEGFYDTPPSAPVNEGFSDIVNEDNK